MPSTPCLPLLPVLNLRLSLELATDQTEEHTLPSILGSANICPMLLEIVLENVRMEPEVF